MIIHAVFSSIYINQAPIHIAALYNRVDLIQQLSEFRSLDINIHDKDGVF